MYHVLGALKSKNSFDRLIGQFHYDWINWSENLSEIEDLQRALAVDEYDLAVIDYNLIWYDDAVALLGRNGVPVLQFVGDFEDCLLQLSARLKAPLPDDLSENSEVPVTGTLADKPKVYPRKMDITFKPVVYDTVYTGMYKSLVSVVNLSSRAGSTFVSLNLAAFLAKLKFIPCIVESPFSEPYLFDFMGLDQKNDPNKALPAFAYAISNNQSTKGMEEVSDGGILYNVLNPATHLKLQDKSVWDFGKIMKLVYSGRKSNLYILDVGSTIHNPEMKQFVLEESDGILVIVDPLPVECMHNEKFLHELKDIREKHKNVHLIVNRWDRGIIQKDLSDFLGIEPAAFMPAIPMSVVYDAVYNFSIPFLNETAQELMTKAMLSISKLFLPVSLVSDHFKEAFDVPDEKPKFSLNSFFRRKKE